jgi:hypothetical protein|mmetsp:Transcript_2832/g.10892  ORF Transcript_2832/g.10892 Transcript_2832/m.10892 type:complete len:99 (+) Transcript_2832:58-354(+)
MSLFVNSDVLQREMVTFDGTAAVVWVESTRGVALRRRRIDGSIAPVRGDHLAKPGMPRILKSSAVKSRRGAEMPGTWERGTRSLPLPVDAPPKTPGKP